jgi:hypothetical protein
VGPRITNQERNEVGKENNKNKRERDENENQHVGGYDGKFK